MHFFPQIFMVLKNPIVNIAQVDSLPRFNHTVRFFIIIISFRLSAGRGFTRKLSRL